MLTRELFNCYDLFSINQLLQAKYCHSPRKSLLTLLLLACFSCACTDQDSKPQNLPRPVKVFRVSQHQEPQVLSFAGEVRPRYETMLAFRVSGKVLTRKVALGQQVRKGDLLAQLDNSDFQAAVAALTAQIAAARAEADFNKADLQRFKELLAEDMLSQPEVDKHETAYIVSRQRLATLEAQLAQSRNQLAYTELRADRDGVITWLQIESGWVVNAGQAVMRLAQTTDKDVVIAIPEQNIHALIAGQAVKVRLWAESGKVYQGKVREVSAAADAATRTFEVRITLLDGLVRAGLGMSATVELPILAEPQTLVPLAAVYSSQNAPAQSRVWLLNETDNTVHTQVVTLGMHGAGENIAVSGLQAGQLIVSAGVHHLQEGQQVRVLLDQATGQGGGD